MDRWKTLIPRPHCARCGDEFPGGSGRFCSAWCWFRYFGWQ